MLGLGIGEITVLLVLVLVVVGPERLPVVVRTLGKAYGQLRRTADELRRAFVLEADRQDAEERFQKLQERREAALRAREEALANAGPGVAAQPDLAPPQGATEPPALSEVESGDEADEAPASEHADEAPRGGA